MSKTAPRKGGDGHPDDRAFSCEAWETLGAATRTRRARAVHPSPGAAGRGWEGSGRSHAPHPPAAPCVFTYTEYTLLLAAMNSRLR